MKKRMIVTIVIIIFFVAIKSSADMRITPDGVTSSDDSASLRLSGSFGDGPDANVIAGKNNYSGPDFSAGVYGSSEGTAGYGVCGRAGNAGNNAENAGGYFLSLGGRGIGVVGESGGLNGYGVFGRANNSGVATNFGGYFESKGTLGRGVYGYASKEGDATNYGGYFVAAGDSGFAVYGSAAGNAGRGVFGIATGTNGRGVDGNASGAHGRGVTGYGEEWDFYARGPGGNYGPFTGAHEVIFSKDMPEQIVPGLIVSVTGKTQTRKDENGGISLSSTLPTVTISTKARDKTVFGVIVSDGPLPEDHWYKGEEGDHFGVVNALGEGRVWVTNRKGDIRAGDYITTSEIPGYGQMQDDDLLHSYTLGKAIETIDWDQVTETVQHDGKMYKRYLIAVVYTSG